MFSRGQDFPYSSVDKESTCNAGDPSSIPGSGRSAGEGIGYPPIFLGFPCGSAGKESTCNVGNLSLIPGLGRSPVGGKGYPRQYSGLKNSMDCIVHGGAKSWAPLSDFHLLYSVVLVSGVRQSDSVRYLALDLKSVFT